MTQAKAKVVALDAVRCAPVADVVELLQGLLARAEAGEIIGIAVGVACHGRYTASNFAIGASTIADLYLGLERCQQRLLNEF